MSFQITSVSPVARYVTVSGALRRAANDVLSTSSREHSFLNAMRFNQLSEVVNSAGHAAWLTAQGAPVIGEHSEQEWKKILTPELVSAFLASVAEKRDLVSAIVKHKRAIGLVWSFFKEGDLERASLICSKLGLPEYLDDNVTDVQLMGAIQAFSSTESGTLLH